MCFSLQRAGRPGQTTSPGPFVSLQHSVLPETDPGPGCCCLLGWADAGPCSIFTVMCGKELTIEGRSMLPDLRHITCFLSASDLYRLKKVGASMSFSEAILARIRTSLALMKKGVKLLPFGHQHLSAGGRRSLQLSNLSLSPQLVHNSMDFHCLIWSILLAENPNMALPYLTPLAKGHNRVFLGSPLVPEKAKIDES